MKILLLDIETAPLITYVWSLYKEVNSHDFIIEDSHILSWAAKWLDKKPIMCKALCDYKLYKTEKTNDKQLLEDLWKLLDEADLVISHNAYKFDLRKINARFLYHGITPPSPYRVIDTLKEAKTYFKFSSNRLDYLGQFLKVGKKLKTGGFELWEEVLHGKMSAWRKMKRYNIHDIVLLEAVYLKLRPYMKTHTNVGLYSEYKDLVCPKCGSKNWIYRGNYYSHVTAYKRISCNDCGGWSRTNIQVLPKDKRTSMLVNAL